MEWLKELFSNPTLLIIIAVVFMMMMGGGGGGGLSLQVLLETLLKLLGGGKIASQMESARKNRLAINKATEDLQAAVDDGDEEGEQIARRRFDRLTRRKRSLDPPAPKA